MFITALAGITHSAASGTIVTRWDGGSNVWAGWLPRCSLQFTMYGRKAGLGIPPSLCGGPQYRIFRMAHPITTTAFTLFACVGARCSTSMLTKTHNLLPHLCRYGPHLG